MPDAHGIDGQTCQPYISRTLPIKPCTRYPLEMSITARRISLFGSLHASPRRYRAGTFQTHFWTDAAGPSSIKGDGANDRLVTHIRASSFIATCVVGSSSESFSDRLRVFSLVPAPRSFSRKLKSPELPRQKRDSFVPPFFFWLFYHYSPAHHSSLFGHGARVSFRAG